MVACLYAALIAFGLAAGTFISGGISADNQLLAWALAATVAVTIACCESGLESGFTGQKGAWISASMGIVIVLLLVRQSNDRGDRFDLASSTMLLLLGIAFVAMPVSSKKS